MLRFKEYLLEANEIVPFGYKDIQPDKRDHRDHVMGQLFSFIKANVPHLRNVEPGLLNHFHKHLDLMLGDNPTHFTEFYKELSTDDEGNTQKIDLEDAVRSLTRRAMNSHLDELKKNKKYSDSSFENATDSRVVLHRHIFKIAEAALATRKDGPDTLSDIVVN